MSDGLGDQHKHYNSNIIIYTYEIQETINKTYPHWILLGCLGLRVFFLMVMPSSCNAKELDGEIVKNTWDSKQFV